MTVPVVAMSGLSVLKNTHAALQFAVCQASMDNA